MRARGASSGGAPPPPRSPVVDRSSYTLVFTVWYLDRSITFGAFCVRLSMCSKGFLTFAVIICDSEALTSVLRFIGPNSIRVLSFPWNSDHFLCKRPIFWKSVATSSSLMRGGKAWFAIEAKSFEICVEEVSKRLKGCIRERSKGFTSWIRFRDYSLKCLST